MEIDRVSAQILRALMGNEPAPPPASPPSAGKDQPGAARRWTPAVLLERGAYLRKMAQLSSGEASETLLEFAPHKAMLSFRARNGEAEVHERFSDVFVVLAGAAVLVTGGEVAGARSFAPGETRGDSIAGGSEQQLRQGDIVHVPAGTPHQFLVSSDRTVLSLVLKLEAPEI